MTSTDRIAYFSHSYEVDGRTISVYTNERPKPAARLQTCRVGRGASVHAIRTVGGEYSWPLCGQPRKLHRPHAVGGEASAETVTCRRCLAKMG